MQDTTGLTDILRLGPLDIHFRINRANWDGQPVPLTTTEFRVVHLLASRAGEDVSYRAIYDVVHGRGFIAGDGSDGYRTNVRDRRSVVEGQRVSVRGYTGGRSVIKKKHSRKTCGRLTIRNIR